MLAPMADSRQALGTRTRRIYRSLPSSAQNVLGPHINRARTALRDPHRAAPSLPFPIGSEIQAVEHRAVESLVQLLRTADLPYFFIPAPEPENIRIGMPEEARASLLSALAADRTGLFVSWSQRWRFHTAPAPTAQSCAPARPSLLWVHHEPRVANLRDALDVARAVQIEFWSPTEGGMHTCEVPNAYSALVNVDATQVHRRSRTGHDLPTFRTFQIPDIAEVTFPVDAVYLWVDDADPAWRARRQQALHALGLDAGHDSIADARFRQHDELKYSLRSLSQFAPWIRHIHLVTDGQRPPWLNTDSPRISVVDHRELFGDRGRLPTYNSHALSAMLHHLPGLADHYLYLNDDFFLGRRTGAEMWFDGNGLPRFYNTATTADPAELPAPSVLARARNHTFDLVEELTGRVRRRNLQHGPYAFSRSVLVELERRIPAEFERTWASQVRSETDFVIERLASQVAHAWGQAVDSRGVRYRYYNVGLHETQPMMAGDLSFRWADTFCINDADGPVPPADRGPILRNFLDAYFPNPSEFELPGAELREPSTR